MKRADLRGDLALPLSKGSPKGPVGTSPGGSLAEGEGEVWSSGTTSEDLGVKPGFKAARLGSLHKYLTAGQYI